MTRNKGICLPWDDDESGKEGLSIQDHIERFDFSERVVHFTDDFDESSVKELCMKLNFLDRDEEKRPITLVLKSYGGSVDAFLMLYDTIHTMNCAVCVVATGCAMSAGAMTLLSGTGMRAATENCRIMLHELSSMKFGVEKASEQNIDAKEAERLQEILNSLIIKHTKLTRDWIEKNIHKDNFFTAKQAKKYGIIDKVIKQIR